LKKVQIITQKVTGQNLLHTVIKVKNFVDNFFRISFLATFSLDLKPASNSVDTHIAFWRHFKITLALFTNFEGKRGRNN
jgi:hypothetical protein